MRLSYLVEVISKRSRDDAWRISLDGNSREHKKIRRMSMDKFYTLVFGIEDAFYRLCAALPQIIEDVVMDNPGLALKNTVYDELAKEHSDILTSLYLLALKHMKDLINSTANDPRYAHIVK